MSTLFAYTARSGDGAFVAGSLQAETLDQAFAHLRTRALVVTSLAPQSSARAFLPGALAAFPAAGSARLAFFRSLATLVRAGVPLRRALEVTIAQCSDWRLREALRSVAADIESGSLLSASMARRPNEFSPLFVAMIRAGETGGVLDEVLERLSFMLERDRTVRKRLAAALAYPAIVAFAAIALVFFLVASIAPSFAGLFQEMHVTLPLSTKIMIAAGEAMRRPPAIALLASVPLLLAGGISLARRHEETSAQLDWAAFTLPILGTLLRKALIARIARTLGTLLRSGVPMLTSLAACEEIAVSAPYRRMLPQVASGLQEGHSLTSMFDASGLFDALFLQLVRVGEETGTLDAMLVHIAEYLDVDVETGIMALGSVVEPVLLVFLGAVVGTIVASVLIPLYSVIGSIK